MKTLVIVESAGKIEKISSILGTNYVVMASYGHIMDLDPKNLAVDVNDYFKPKYIINADKCAIVKKLKKTAEECDNVLLATDKDREGEMIAWNIANVLNLDLHKENRITFTEITKTEILKAVKNPIKIDVNYVDAQKARRILDRIVGYKISPVLQRMLHADSAGRVQSVVTKIIIDRENEIINTKDSYYYTIEGSFDIIESANLVTKEIINSKDEARKIINTLINSKFKVESISNKETSSKPNAPFTTSTLQQEAYNKLGMNAKRTMVAAQHLYESGHITYMRTDSVNLCEDALKNIKKYILDNYDDSYYHLTKYSIDNVQGAHEAIRPTNISVCKLNINNSDEVRLYDIIWKRTIASQMSPAKYNVMTITINTCIKENYFVAKYQTMLFAGYKIIYAKDGDDINYNVKVKEGDKIELITLIGQQHYNKPPYRYNESSLIKRLDPSDLNIGRPSTYASILSVIQERGYVKLDNIIGIEKDVNAITWNTKDGIKDTLIKTIFGNENNKLIPTQLGIQVNDFLIKHFPTILDYNFTANMELELDLVADGKCVWHSIIKKLYDCIMPCVNEFNNKKKEITSHVLIGKHPETKNNIYKDIGKYGAYLKMEKEPNSTTYIMAPIKTPYTYENISLEEAIEIFIYPKILGKYGRKNVILKKGKYGCYIVCGTEKYPIVDNNIDLAKAIDIIKTAEEKKLFTIKDGKVMYTILEGAYGKYINIRQGTKSKNVKIKDLNIDMKDMDLKKIKELVNKKYTKNIEKK